MQICKPLHNRYALVFMSNETYVKYATVYSGCKRWGVRGVYSFLGGTELVGVAKDSVVQYSKRHFATAVSTCATYVCAPAVVMITNATKVVKCCKVSCTSIGYVAEAFEDASQVTFLPLDTALFGQPIPANTEGRFSS